MGIFDKKKLAVDEMQAGHVPTDDKKQLSKEHEAQAERNARDEDTEG
jgi:hypothetical protein